MPDAWTVFGGIVDGAPPRVGLAPVVDCRVSGGIADDGGAPRRRRIALAAIAALLLIGHPAAAQPSVRTSGFTSSEPVAVSTHTPLVNAHGSSGSSSQPATTPAQSPTALSRWINIQAGTVATRYRYIESSTGVVGSNHVQSQASVRARFKFDRDGRVSLNMLAATGNNFTGSWNNTGLGTGDLTWDFAVKHLFLAASPLKGIELSFGSLAPVRGESTEITTLDNDGYLAGERISVKRGKALYFDEIGFTSAYVGDPLTPNLFDRADRLTGSRNYFQYLVSKRFNARIAASADYTRQDGVPIVHAAVTTTVPFRVIDTVKFEQYIRGGDHHAAGFGVFGEKVIATTLTLGVGYASIDEDYDSLNADRFNRGNRVYESATIRLTQELSMFVWAGRAVATGFRISNKYRVDVGLAYNVLGHVRRHGWK